MNTQELGQFGETKAAEYLLKQRYQIIARNLRYEIGEIDILAKDGKSIVIVEVKAGRTGQFGYAIERVGPQKQRKLRQLAGRVSQDYPRSPLRIDLVNVDPGSGELLHIMNAVEAAA